MKIVPISPFDKQALELIAAADEFSMSLYPAESNHLEPPTALAAPNVLFAGAWDGPLLTGIGAIIQHEDYGEIKRMYVRESHRGRGIAKAIVRYLEATYG